MDRISEDKDPCFLLNSAADAKQDGDTLDMIAQSVQAAAVECSSSNSSSAPTAAVVELLERLW
jgi:hypothetical protein